MTPEYAQEIAANLERAGQSIQAAKDLAVKGYHDFAASRAYYAAFYGATAVLLNEGLDFSSSSSVFDRAPASINCVEALARRQALVEKGALPPDFPISARLREFAEVV